ncbi:hypothetical protein [Mycobacterium kyorinense]|uniref:Uncharacterized protein n=1 Tax=Mycobacterium kyorinense TaxID=487514 RepID=A0A1X1Y7Z9_9MYCO|nr:hypothetical protein [Mycobacterium kyorinense]ORW07195.1 hypothetical protein AWC14_24970 [Mycobacterium kyorinense]
MIHEWAAISGNYLPESPYRPIGLLGAILRWHGNLQAPPGAAERARDAERAAVRAAVDACPVCDASGWIELADGLHRCRRHLNFGADQRFTDNA